MASWQPAMTCRCPAFGALSTNNGGPVAGSSLGTISGMLTRAPNPSSPLLDRGDTNGCRDVNGTTLLTTDQLGNPRAIDGPDPDTTARCDIGAVERLDAGRRKRQGHIADPQADDIHGRIAFREIVDPFRYIRKKVITR